MKPIQIYTVTGTRKPYTLEEIASFYLVGCVPRKKRKKFALSKPIFAEPLIPYDRAIIFKRNQDEKSI